MACDAIPSAFAFFSREKLGDRVPVRLLRTVPFVCWALFSSTHAVAQSEVTAASTLSGHERAVNSAYFSPDEKWIVMASSDKIARILERATGKPLRTLAGHAEGVRRAVFSPYGKTIVTASLDGTAKIWMIE